MLNKKFTRKIKKVSIPKKKKKVDLMFTSDDDLEFELIFTKDSSDEDEESDNGRK